ncbi:diguanylate cyclase [Thermoleptolyngbya sp. M55_K2018_002]|uniref:diguanylate cyclase domain-containing protein n=1 Tax=Thermoleptolyngbya sp. M55_K2018_002 TaxID=2747808 RepID=UPI0025F1428D|nr:diguanylate cyclase [Thermoleptolyngbya sp. M55_K2018_002]
MKKSNAESSSNELGGSVMEAPDVDVINILIVDDTPANLQLLTSLLRRRGYEVRAANSGALGLAIARATRTEVVLLDISMPEMDGFTVCEQLKSDQRTRDISVIFVSALSEVVDKVKAFAVGGVDYITKPFHVQEVVARVETHLTLRRLQQQLQAQNERLQQEMRDRLAAEAALQAANLELKRLANSDGLTQVANRRRFDEYLSQEWQHMLREQQPLSLILCDVDCFKAYNDVYGHQEGDQCLRQVAQVIDAAVKRAVDLVARYGGEEFAMILPNTASEGAQQVAQEIQASIKALALPHAASSAAPIVTLSQGIATLIPQLDEEPDQLIAAADQALYRAKQSGRDRIVVATPDSEPPIRTADPNRRSSATPGASGWEPQPDGETPPE